MRYHLKEFSDPPPENEQELFNLRHSSLRTTIEPGFGVLKKCFQVLDAESFWSFETQVKVVLACCMVHNHIMGIEPNDHIMEDAMNQVESSDPNKKHNHVESPLMTVDCGMLREMRYAKLCGLIIPRVESSTLFRFL